MSELPPLKRGPQYFALKMEIEDFLFREAELLDQRKFKEWFDLLAEDILYFMPMKQNVKFGLHAERENTKAGVGISWFDEDRWTIGKRIDQILTGVHFAEEPLSRVCRLVTNVIIQDAQPTLVDPSEVRVSSRFAIYQNRVEHENYTYFGKRTDVLRRAGDDWKIARREISLDQSVLLAKNLSIFF